MKHGTLLVWLLCGGAALGVMPETWDHASESDFSGGRFEGTVVSSLGELRLSRALTILMPSENAPAIVSAMAQADNVLYVGDGTEPAVHRVRDGKAEKLAVLPGAVVCAMAWTEGKLLVGTGGGEAPGLYRVWPDGKVKRIWADEKVKYVWAILPAERGRLYVATGPEGKVFAVDGEDKAEEVYSAGKLAKNILCLAASSKGLLYAGTDEKGLVLEIDPKKKASRILLDADETEISSLIADESGGLYVATADTAKAGPDGGRRPGAGKVGRPELLGAPETAPAEVPDEGPEEAETVAPATPQSQPAEKGEQGEEPILTPEPAGGKGLARADVLRTAASRPSLVIPGDAAPGAGEGPQEAPDEQEMESEPRNGMPPGIPAELMQRMAEARGGGERKGAARPVAGPGNAVYYIRPDGLVETRFRRPVTILAMQLRDGKLYLGAGNGGTIYVVSADGEETAQLADTDAKQVTALAFGQGGRLLFATANKGSVGVLGADFAEKGTFVSESLDAGQIARWGTLRVLAAAADAARVTVATRSGNVQEAEDETWSRWSNEQPAVNEFLAIESPAGRFLQYRLTLTRGKGASPSVREVRAIYQVGNLPPSVEAVSVKASDKGADRSQGTGGPQVFRHVMVRATDPNGDELSFHIEFRQQGGQQWITIGKDLKEPRYVWDTRTVGDGRYEMRVRASDAPANPPASALTAWRISELVVVDNTPPVVQDVGVKPVDGKLLLSGKAADATSRIVSLAYSVDSQEEWTVLAARDGICDSDTESFSAELTVLAAGAHRIAVKVTDLYGNVGYASVNVTVKP